MPLSATKLPERNLDVLRAVAVLCVLTDHVVIAATPPGNLTWGWVGRAGVLIFFVHTALVLMGSLERGDGSRPGWIPRFYIRRAWRIYPLAIVAVLLALALRVPIHSVHIGFPAPYDRPDNGTILSNLLLVQNLAIKPDILGVLWTLPIEVQMYLALPFCFLIARRGVRSLSLLVLAGAAAALATKAQLPIPGLWRLNTLIYVPCFLGGVLAYALLRRTRPARLSPSLTLLAVVALMGAYFLLRGNYTWLAPQWAFCLALGVIIANGREMAASALSSAAHVIARYSYGIYLLHQIALWIALVAFAGAPLMARWAIFAFLVIVLPWSAFHLIEQPGIAIAQRIVHGRMPQEAPVGAP